MSESDAPTQPPGPLWLAWSGPGPGECPLCRNGTYGSDYRFPTDLEESARIVHGPTHSIEEYSGELARIGEFVTYAHAAFDSLMADVAERRARVMRWSRAEGDVADSAATSRFVHAHPDRPVPAATSSVVPDEVGRGATR